MYGSGITVPTDVVNQYKRYGPRNDGMKVDIVQEHSVDEINDYARRLHDSIQTAYDTFGFGNYQRDLPSGQENRKKFIFAEAVARHIQKFTYKIPKKDNGRLYYKHPGATLLSNNGACTDTSTLISYILSSSSFDYSTCLATTKLRGERHAVAGIDRRDFGYQSRSEVPSQLYTMAVPDVLINEHNYPDTDYIFIESAASRPLGTFAPDLYTEPTPIFTFNPNSKLEESS
jgi:hypothetical protein